MWGRELYLCICSLLFVPQIKVPRGEFICATNKKRKISSNTVTILNASPLTTRIIFAFFPGHLSHEKNHESKYSHLPYRNRPYKNLPKAKSALHIPHQIKIKVSIYITRDQTVAPWHWLGPSHFHDYHRIAILITAFKHITIVHFVFVSITFQYFLSYYGFTSMPLNSVTKKETECRL